MFAETLRDMASRMDDISGILLMGMDGLPIEKLILDESLNTEALTAEFTTVIKLTNLTASEVGAGSLEEVIVLSDQMILLTKSITSDYFLLMILPRDGNLGRARFELKKAKYVLEKEFV